jgi:hypothetical protein
MTVLKSSNLLALATNLRFQNRKEDSHTGLHLGCSEGGEQVSCSFCTEISAQTKRCKQEVIVVQKTIYSVPYLRKFGQQTFPYTAKKIGVAICYSISLFCTKS